jgi:hypothetical protein
MREEVAVDYHTSLMPYRAKPDTSDMLLFDLVPNFGYEMVRFYNFLNYEITFSFKIGTYLVLWCCNF